MATAKNAAKAETPEVSVKGSKGKSILVMGLVGVVFLAAGAGGAWWFFGRHAAPAAPVQGAEPVAAVAAPTTPPAYLPIDTMVVNLAGDNEDRLAQLGIVLALSDEKSADRIKAFLPSIRNATILMVSQRSATELLTRDGKDKLAKDVQAEIARILGGSSPVREVLFSNLIIQ